MSKHMKILIALFLCIISIAAGGAYYAGYNLTVKSMDFKGIILGSNNTIKLSMIVENSTGIPLYIVGLKSKITYQNGQTAVMKLGNVDFKKGYNKIEGDLVYSTYVPNITAPAKGDVILTGLAYGILPFRIKY